MIRAEWLRREFGARRGSTPDEVWICCPFCPDHGQTADTRFRLGVNVRTGVGHCFNCEYKSRDVLADLGLVTERDDARDDAESRAKEKENSPEPEDDRDWRYEPLPGDPQDEIAAAAGRYLHVRGVPEWQIRRKRLGFARSGRFRYRVLFPVRESTGGTIAMVGRTWVEGIEPKYKNSIGMRWFYNAPKKRRSRIVVAEGPLDALAIDRSMNPPGQGREWDVVAVLGRKTTDAQEAYLRQYQRVVLWADRDRVGFEGFEKLAGLLADLERDVSLVMAGEGKDAADTDEKEIRDRVYGARRWDAVSALRFRADVAFL